MNGIMFSTIMLEIHLSLKRQKSSLPEFIKFEDLPNAMESVLEKLSLIELELENIKNNIYPKEPVDLMTVNHQIKVN